MASLTTPTTTISAEGLHLDDILAIMRGHRPVALSADPKFRANLRRGQEVLQRKLHGGEVIYGVNTGFGGNVKFLIPDTELQHHQRNLIEYHCCGVGEPFPEEVVRGEAALP